MNDNVETPAPTDEQMKLPPGRCQQCGALVERGAIESYEGRPPLHRRPTKANVLGDLCGPVLTTWTYHMVYLDTERRVRTAIQAIPMPIEEPGAIRAMCRAFDADPAPDLEQPPRSELLDWHLLGVS